MPRPSEDRWFTTAETAELLRESVLTTMRKCARGEIAATKAGRSWRISATALDAYLTPAPLPALEAPEPTYLTASAKRRARRSALPVPRDRDDGRREAGH